MTTNLGLANIENPGILLKELRRSNALKNFKAAGWRMQPQNPCHGRALPTPKSTILEGAGLDSLLVAVTVLEWYTLVAE